MIIPRPVSDRFEECANEPIHRLGLVQSHGILIGVNKETLHITHISETVSQFFEASAPDLIGKDLINYFDEKYKEPLGRALHSPAYTFNNPLLIRLKINGKSLWCDCVAHRSGETIILEMEPKDTAEKISSGLDTHFSLTSSTLLSIRSDSTVEFIADQMAEDIKEFTQFDRVMIYRFDKNYNGQVIAERVENEYPPYLGLHYPESDIPKQARELYEKSWIRIIRDVSDNGLPILSKTAPPEGDPDLDLSQSTLRSVSPYHLLYLRNMGVKASMSISILDSAGKLWGLIACHNYKGPKFLNYSARAACTHYSLVLSSRLTTAEQNQATAAESIQRRRLPNAIRSLLGGSNLQRTIIENSEGILELLAADGLAVARDGILQSAGTTPQPATIKKIHEALNELYPLENICALSSLEEINLDSPDGAGVLRIQIGEEMQVLFFRREYVHEVQWGGDPNDTPEEKTLGKLSPRNSFKIFTENVKGRSREWTAADRSLAQEFRASLASFIIERNNQLEELNVELKERNSEIQQFAYSISHDLKSPLVTVGGYVKAVEEDLADGDYEEATHSLSRIKLAVDRMGNLINDLLTFSRIGRSGERPIWLDMTKIFATLQDEFKDTISENAVEVIFPEEPEDVYGVAPDVVRSLQNLLENAIKYMSADQKAPKITISCYSHDKITTYEVADNGPGIDPVYHDRIFKLFERLDNKTTGTGLGLATVMKVMEQLGGQVELESELGQGAKFKLRFPKPRGVKTSNE